MLEVIIKLKEQGNYDTAVYHFIGIEESTWFRWKQRGAKEKSDSKSIYARFIKGIKKAEGKAEAYLVQLILAAAKNKNWTAAAWMLERKHSDRWGKKDELKLNQSADRTIVMNTPDKSWLGWEVEPLTPETPADGESKNELNPKEIREPNDDDKTKI